MPETQSVPVWPWVARAGRAAMRHGVYVYEANVNGLTLGASNGSLDGRALRRYWIRISLEELEAAYFDVVDYAAREIRRSVDAGYVMTPDTALESWLRAR